MREKLNRDVKLREWFRPLAPSVLEEESEAALAAVCQYLFKPAMVAGQPIAVWVAVVVAFRR
jgi:predicted NodU family carbamoyl transferase